MFLGEPPANEATEAAYAEDRDSDGYVGNVTRLWCWRPESPDIVCHAASYPDEELGADRP